MINLSDKLFGNDEISLLQKGLTFIPKPKQPSDEDVKQSFERFSRRLKLAWHFSGNKINNTQPKLFQEKSDWTPNDDSIHPGILEDIVKATEELENTNLKNVGSNLMVGEGAALNRLKNDLDIVIKPADKGSATVIMNRSDYVYEATRQLNNDVHYKKISEPVHPLIKNRVNDILTSLKNQKRINKKQLEYLSVPENPRARQFYLLPKIHKDPGMWTIPDKMPPGRPIVSDCSSDVYNVTEYIDHFLSPLAKEHSSYVKDTPDFLDKISKIKSSPNCILATIDVDSLYTNIDNNLGLQAVKEAFDENPNSKRPDREVLELLKLCLENNDFKFDKDWYLQVSGTAMGKKFAPNYANLAMAKWEKEALSKCPVKPSCYLRFLDDIFIIWENSEEEFWQFFNILNDHHPTIKLKATIHRESIDFLDVTVFKGNRFCESQVLDSKVYFKPTHTHDLLHKSSYHPKHTFKGILKSQIIRFHRICNNVEDFDQACSVLFRALRTRGYSSRFLRATKSETLKQLDPVKNSNYGSFQCESRKCKSCPFIETTKAIKDSEGNEVHLQSRMTCQSASLIYLIECKSCGERYVGESKTSLHERLAGHRSDIKNKKNTPVAKHFNNGTCNGLDDLAITPLELVPQCHPTDELGLVSIKDIVHRMEREQFWMKKLKTRDPWGMNKKTELPPPIPFIIPHSDQAYRVSQKVRVMYEKLKVKFIGVFGRTRFITAYRKNRNLKDILVSTKLRDLST